MFGSRSANGCRVRGLLFGDYTEHFWSGSLFRGFKVFLLPSFSATLFIQQAPCTDGFGHGERGTKHSMEVMREELLDWTFELSLIMTGGILQQGRQDFLACYTGKCYVERG